MGTPWFKFYPTDYLADAKVRMLSRIHRSMLLDCWCWIAKEGSIPSDPNELSFLLGDDPRSCRSFLQIAVRFFYEDMGRLYSHRLSQESEKYNLKVDKLRANASLGGMAKVANAKANALANALANGLAKPAESESESEKDITPLPPSRGKRTKLPKVELDIQPENEEYLRKVYAGWPTRHPLTGEPAKKGAFAPAARNFQRIIDTGEATNRELKSCGTLYAKAESFPQDVQRLIYDAWDHRDHAIMHVATFYGPEKKPYRQMLPIARIVLARIDAQKEQVPA